MKTQLIFGCLFAALIAPALYADDTEPKDKFFNLILSDDDEGETSKEGYVFAFADHKGVSFQMVGEEIATTEDTTEETSSDDDEAPRAEEV